MEKAGLASKYGVRAEPPGDRPRGMRGFYAEEIFRPARLRAIGPS